MVVKRKRARDSQTENERESKGLREGGNQTRCRLFHPSRTLANHHSKTTMFPLPKPSPHHPRVQRGPKGKRYSPGSFARSVVWFRIGEELSVLLCKRHVPMPCPCRSNMARARTRPLTSFDGLYSLDVYPVVARVLVPRMFVGGSQERKGKRGIEVLKYAVVPFGCSTCGILVENGRRGCSFE
jgi:hypothetical protein